MRVIVNSSPRAFAAAGENLYVKEVLRAGEYNHPIHGWNLKATPEYLTKVAAASNAALASGVEVPVPDGHTHDAAGNVGWAREFFVGEGEDGTPALMSRIEVTDPKYAAKIDDGSIDKVSVYLDDIGDGQHTPDHDRVVHVALTAYPVASKQGGFVRLSVDAPEIPVVEAARTEENPMKFDIPTSRAKALGIAIPEGHDGDTVEVSAEALTEIAETALAARDEAEKARDEAEKARDEAATALSARDEEAPEATVLRVLSVDPKANRHFARAQKSLAAAVESEIALAMKAGKIDKRGEEALKGLLSVESAYTLSTEGEASEFDVAEAVKTLLGMIPEGAAVPTTEMDVSAVETPDSDEDAGKKASVNRMTEAANG